MLDFDLAKGGLSRAYRNGTGVCTYIEKEVFEICDSQFGGDVGATDVGLREKTMRERGLAKKKKGRLTEQAPIV